MKKNILYILLIIILLLVITALVLVIINLYNKQKNPLVVSQPVIEQRFTKSIDFSKYGITPREAMYYE